MFTCARYSLSIYDRDKTYLIIFLSQVELFSFRYSDIENNIIEKTFTAKHMNKLCLVRNFRREERYSLPMLTLMKLL